MKENTTHKHKFNVLTIENSLEGTHNREAIHVSLECSCEYDIPQPVVSFYSNDLLSAKQNYHGWLSSIAPALVQQDYRINDQRKELTEGGNNNDKQ